MTGQQLKNSILQMAVQGKLVPQDPNDEPASVLLERIRAEKEKLIKEGKIKKEKNPSVIFRGADNLPYEKIGKNEPVCIADEVPFEIPESWEWVRLGTLVELISDGTHRTPTYTDQGVPFLSVQNVSKGYFDLSRIKYISENEHKKLCERVRPKKNDVLVCRIGTLGKAIKCTLDFEFSIFVSLALLRFVSVEIVDYVVAYINSPSGFNWIQENKVGGGTHTFKINLSDFPKMLIPFPPLEEQFRIIEKLRKFQSYIERYTELEKNVKRLDKKIPDNLKKSILQYAVQGKLVPQDPTDESASVLLERIHAEKEQLIKSGKIKRDKHESVIFRRDNSYYERVDGIERCIDDEIPFEIPDSWEWSRLYTFGTFSSGKTPTMSNPDFWNGEIPWVTSKDMKHPIITDSEMHITNEAAASMKIYPSGTLVLVARSGILKRLLPLCKLGTESTINQDIKAFSLYDISESQWLYYAIKAFEPYILKELVKSVTTVESLKFDEFQNLLIPVPPKCEQDKIVVKLDNLMKMLQKQSSDPLFLL